MSACWGSTDMKQTTSEMHAAMIAGLRAERERIARRQRWERAEEIQRIGGVLDPKAASPSPLRRAAVRRE